MNSRFFGPLALIGLAGVAASLIGLGIYRLTARQPPVETAQETAGSFAVRAASAGAPLQRFDGELAFPSRFSQNGSAAVSLAVGVNQTTVAAPGTLASRAAKSSPIVLDLPPSVSTSDVLITAELIAGGFDVEPKVQRWQALDRLPVAWDWALRPRSYGDHAVVVHIIAAWKENGEERSQEVWRTRESRTIRVSKERKSPVSLGQLSVTGVLGSAMTVFVVPWYFSRRKAGEATPIPPPPSAVPAA